MHVAHLAEGLAAKGYDVTVLSQMYYNDPAPRSEVGPHGVRILRFPDSTRSARFPMALGLRTHLRRYAGNYDVIHAHSFHAWPALVAANAAEKQFVFTPHYHGVGHTTAARIAHLVYDPIATRIFKRSASIICVSEIEATRLADDYPFTHSSTVVIPNGIDMASIERAEPYDVDHPVVLTAGRLEDYKQIDLVMAAMEHVGHDAELIVIGDGPVRRDLERIARNAATRRPVRMTGRIEQHELRNWQRTAALTLCLSKEEAFGMVAAEGVASGSRVVASDIPAHRELADQAAGRMRLVPVQIGPEALARVIDAELESLDARRNAEDAGDAPFADWNDVVAEVELAYFPHLATSPTP